MFMFIPKWKIPRLLQRYSSFQIWICIEKWWNAVTEYIQRINRIFYLHCVGMSTKWNRNIIYLFRRTISNVSVKRGICKTCRQKITPWFPSTNPAHGCLSQCSVRQAFCCQPHTGNVTTCIELFVADSVCCCVSEHFPLEVGIIRMRFHVCCRSTVLLLTCSYFKQLKGNKKHKHLSVVL
jgi:hypothetical protein